MTQARELLTAADIAAMPAQRRVHPLNENAVRLQKSLGDAAGLTQLGFHHVTVMPGHDSTEYHRHLYEEECLYILSGQGEAIIDEQTYAVGPGDFMGFPRRGVAHTMVNKGSEPLVYLVVGPRIEHDVCDYPRLGRRLHVNGADKVFVDLPKTEG
jgi:uncharacterized cupin superfamily protein